MNLSDQLCCQSRSSNNANSKQESKTSDSTTSWELLWGSAQSDPRSIRMQPISPTMPSAFPVGDSKVHYRDKHTIAGSIYMSLLCDKVLWAAMFRSAKCVSVLVARPVSLQASVTAFTLIMALLRFCVPHWNDGSKSNLHMAALIARSPATLTSQAAHFRDCPFTRLWPFFFLGWK